MDSPEKRGIDYAYRMISLGFIYQLHLLMQNIDEQNKQIRTGVKSGLNFGVIDETHIPDWRIQAHDDTYQKTVYKVKQIAISIDSPTTHKPIKIILELSDRSGNTKKIIYKLPPNTVKDKTMDENDRIILNQLVLRLIDYYANKTHTI